MSQSIPEPEVSAAPAGELEETLRTLRGELRRAATVRGARAASPSHPPLSAANQRQGRALHSDADQRMGVRTRLLDVSGAHRTAHAVARPLQLQATTRLSPPPPAGLAVEQPGWELHLAQHSRQPERR